MYVRFRKNDIIRKSLINIMNALTEELKERLNKNLNRQKQIDKSMDFLPKGHINTLYRSNKGYYYLTYREGKKIRNVYLGPEGKTDLSKTIQKLHERQTKEKELKELKKEEKRLNRILRREK